MAAAFQALVHDEVPRGTSALNAIQRIAGALGTAVLAVVLQRAIAADIPGFRGGIEGTAALSRRPHAAPLLADAFGTTFWVAVALIAVSLVPALLLPGTRPARQAGEAEPVIGEERREAA
jgi:hypothetical protein